MRKLSGIGQKRSSQDDYGYRCISAQRVHAQMSKLPKNWRSVDQDGQTLYWVRRCGDYMILPIRLPTGKTIYQCEHHWQPFATVETLDLGFVACLDDIEQRKRVAA